MLGAAWFAVGHHALRARRKLGGEVATALNPTRQMDDGDNE